LPKGLAEAAAPRCLTSTEDAVDVTYAFGNHTLKLRYAKSGRGVEVRAAWQGGVPQGAAVLFDVPSAQSWFASTAEGVFESPFRVRHPGFDGIVGSIYRLPQGSATVWDSRLHPFGLSEPSARVGAACDGRDVSFGFDPACLPASVQVQDRVGAAHGMKVVMAWRDEDHSVQGGGRLLALRRAWPRRPGLRCNGCGDSPPRRRPIQARRLWQSAWRRRACRLWVVWAACPRR
jgi:hypothetical protein